MNTTSITLKTIVYCLVALLPLSLTAQNSYIQIEAEPAISIFLDNTFKGITSTDFGGLIINDVTPGTHFIKVVKEGYKPREEQIFVNSGEIYKYFVSSLIPKIRIFESGKTEQKDTDLKTGSLKLQSLPISMTIIIPSLGVNYDKMRDTWQAEEVPIGNYPASFIGNNLTLYDTITINLNSLTHLYIDLIAGNIEDLTPATRYQKITDSIPILPVVTDKKFNNDSFIDPRDGKQYKTVKIGTQIWLAENLAFLPKVSPSNKGSNIKQYFYVYGYEGNRIFEAQEIANYKKYGVLYNWTAAKSACPQGWHLPDDQEWSLLSKYLSDKGYGNNDNYNNNKNDIGKSMASVSEWDVTSFSGVIGNDQSKNNRSGFNALPGGQRQVDSGFSQLHKFAFYWSSSTLGSIRAWYRYLYYDYNGMYRFPNYQNHGFSVRCLQNQILNSP